MKNQQCGTCVSRRIGNEKGEFRCSLGVNKYLGDEKCGSYANSSVEMDDYKFEYGDLSVDEITENWLNGEEI